MEHLKKQDSECPYVSLRSIDTLKQTFWGHVNWAANVDILECLPEITRNLRCLFGKTEVCDFGDSISDEDVGYFDIPMDNVEF